jgi:hypothetical protein
MAVIEADVLLGMSGNPAVPALPLGVQIAMKKALIASTEVEIAQLKSDKVKLRNDLAALLAQKE